MVVFVSKGADEEEEEEDEDEEDEEEEEGMLVEIGFVFVPLVSINESMIGMVRQLISAKNTMRDSNTDAQSHLKMN